MHTAPYFSALGLLTIVHAVRVISLRWKHKISLGDGGNQELNVMIRVFGNHAEYAPIGLILLAALEFVQAPAWYLHFTGMTLVVGRLLHAYGLPKSPGHIGRVAGMILTLTSIGLGSIGVMLFTLWGSH
ncbi:MAG: MAPEG family protein [Bdellovibrionota bacterium]